jgi:hypothetical protein
LRRFDIDTIANPNALISTDFLAAHLNETSIRVGAPIVVPLSA